MVIFNEVSVEKKDLRDQSVTATAQCEWHEECGEWRHWGELDAANGTGQLKEGLNKLKSLCMLA